MSIDELVKVEITSVSRRPQSVENAPAAAFLIRQHDIRRSGAVNLAEALRLAPNLHVARLETLGYSISARGFNGYDTANKLQVLIDGRSIYSLLHSAVYWDAQDVFLPDLDRIEVVSGPGGTLWGSNAVNGVINVVSKRALDTQGALANITLGTKDRRASARYGGTLGDRAAYRFYVQGFEREHPNPLAGIDLGDDWNGLQGGFRVDLDGGADSFTVQGDVSDFETEVEVAGLPTFHWGLEGENVLARWRRDLNGGAALELQGYVDRSRRDYFGVVERVDTYATEFQHNFAPWEGHRIVWGGGHRIIRDDFRNTLNAFVLDPRKRWLNLSDVFVQDEMALTPELALTLGLKLERSSFTGWEYLPNARLAWQAPEGALLWTAVSRAVRTPSRVDRELVAPGVLVRGSFGSEKLIAFEAGYRGRPLDRTSLSVSTFFNVYDDIRTTEPVTTAPLPLALANGIRGESWGVEVWGEYLLTDWWRLSAGATILRKDFRLKGGRNDRANFAAVGNDPDWHGQVRSRMNLAGGLELDLAVRTVDDLSAPALPGYTLVDARLGWRLLDSLELSLAGDNLLNERHTEMTENPARRVFGRTVQLRARWSL
ncbi:TonB-dependent receptor plug domain-containing protein [Indioceanicola profundi]|uniref:TonB-dependent receptor plug domain-containing protein n=1 Tax=Indioceanicola profundi TaxID=2220096 RepID=UPI0013C41AA4|nr:TonB-dependent receptor [Indioceanicola profundi]